MKSSIEIVAESRDGRSVVTAIRGGGHFAGRQTDPDTVHLIGTAAGPLGGDEVTITLRVGPGARLIVRSAAATVVLPGPVRPDSRLTIEAFVDDGGRLVFEPEPTVLAGSCEHEARAVVELRGSGQVRLLEQVLLGRSGEPGGTWAGRTTITRDGVPVLRHTLRSAVLNGRSLVTLIDTAATPRAAATGNCVAMPLARGGLLVTGVGNTATAVLAEVEGAAALALAPELAAT